MGKPMEPELAVGLDSSTHFETDGRQNCPPRCPRQPKCKVKRNSFDFSELVWESKYIYSASADINISQT